MSQQTDSHTSHRTPQPAPRWLALLVAGLTLLALWAWSALPAGAVPAGFQEYLILGNETQVLEMFRVIQGNPGLAGRMASVITVVATTDYQVVYYDHWEDGYEPDLLNPVQASTEIYGDSGSAAGMLRAGDVITLNSDGGTGIHATVPVPRGQAFRYDGGDRLLSIGGPIDIVHSLWPAQDIRVGGAWEIYPVGAWATGYSYIVPVGQDLYDASQDYMGDFQHVYLQIQALADNTTVHINNGREDISVRLDLGQTYSSMGYRDGSQEGIPSISILAGTTLLSNQPIQGGLVTGQTVNQSRFFSLVPDADWGTQYVAPIPRTNERPAEVYLYNPDTSYTTITAYDRDRAEGQTFVLPGETTQAYRHPDAVGAAIPAFSAVRLTSLDPIWAVASADAGQQSYDWGFSFLPTRFAGREVYVSWAPGADTSDDPPHNASPVWVAPLNDNTLFTVDYQVNGDGTPDLAFVLDALHMRRIADPDGDNTGMHILADKPFIAVWGEDPSVANLSLGRDMGYPILPLDESWQDQVLTLNKTPDVQTLPPEGGLLGFSLLAETGDYPISRLDITDTLPLPCQYVPGSTSITYPDGRTSSVDPTVTDQTLWWPLDAQLLAHQAVTLTFQAQLTPQGPLGPTSHDNMESGGYAGGQGWTGPWVEDESACAGDCVLVTALDTPHSGLYHLSLAEAGIVSRSLDLTAFQQPTLRLWHKMLPETLTSLTVRVYDGTEWTTLLALDSGTATGTYMAEQLDLSRYRSAQARIEFAGSGVGQTYLDDVQVFDAAAEYTNVAQATGIYHNHWFTARDRARILISPLSIHQLVDRTHAAAGDRLTYTLHYINDSTTLSATNGLIRHSLHANTTFISASPGYLYQAAAHTLVWGRETPLTLLPGATGTLTATVVVDQWSTNGQRLRSQSYLDSDQTPELASNLTETIIRAPEMVLTKHGPDRAAPGETITYTIAYTNTGRISATGVVIRDRVPTSTQYQLQSIALDTGDGYVPLTDAEDQDAGQVLGNTVIVQPGQIRGRVAPGESGRIRFSVRVEPSAPVGQNIANHATLLRDYARPQNSALLLTTITDLALTKQADRSLTGPGDTIAYTMTLQGSTQLAPTEVYLQDAIPAHTRYLPGSASLPPGFALFYSTDYGNTWTQVQPGDPRSITHLRWYAPSILDPGGIDLAYRVVVQNPLTGPNITICNQASAWSTFTPRFGSNRVCIETIDLALAKTYAGGAQAVPGQTIAYTLHSSNRGSATALDTTLEETVPAYTLFDARASSPGWSCPQDAPAGTLCTLSLGDLALGETQETQFVVRVLDSVPPGADVVLNQARLYSRHGFGVTQTHLLDLHAQAELVVDKTDGLTTANAGDVLTYTIALYNAGNRGAAGIVLTDTLPLDVVYLPGSASDGGRYDPATHQVVWPLSTGLPGRQETVRTYQVQVPDTLPLDVLYLTNTVQVRDDGQNGDTDDGNLATDVDTIDRQPALRIVKLGPDTAEVGQRIVYTMTVATVSYTPTGLSAAGLSAARIGDGSPVRQIQIIDPLVPAVHYVSGDDGDGLLEWMETWVYTATYTVTTANRGALVNVATVQGVDINGDPVTAANSVTTHVPGQTLFLPFILHER